MKRNNRSLVTLDTQALDRISGGCRAVATESPRFARGSLGLIADVGIASPTIEPAFDRGTLLAERVSAAIGELAVAETYTSDMLDTSDDVAATDTPVDDMLDVQGDETDGMPSLSCGTPMPSLSCGTPTGTWEDCDDECAPELTDTDDMQPTDTSTTDAPQPSILAIAEPTASASHNVRDHRAAATSADAAPAAQPVIRDHRA